MSANGMGIGLDDIKADRLRDVAYSAEIDTEGTAKKSDLVEALHEADVKLGSDGWTKDGEPFDVEERPSGGTRGPKDVTALYAFRRQNDHCDEVLGLVEEALADTGYEVREGETSSGKKTASVVLPAEAQEPDESADEETDVPTCSETKENGEPCTREVDEEGDVCFQHESS